MTDDPLRALRPPRRPVPVAGAERAMQAGRRRRHRRRATATGLAAVPLVAVAATWVRAGGPADSVTADVGDPSPSAPASPSTEPSGAPPTPTPSETTEARPSPSASEPTAEPQPTPSQPSPTHPPGRYVGHGSRVATREAFRDPTFCQTSAQQQPSSPGPSGYCSRLDAPETVMPGQPAELAFTLCRAPTAGGGWLTFQTEREVAVHAYPTDSYDEPRPITWAWGEGRAWPARPHMVRMEAGDCQRWTVEWVGQDNAGWAVEAGEYEVVAVSRADELYGEDADFVGPPGTRQVTVS